MAVHRNDYTGETITPYDPKSGLRELFYSRALDERELIWLWLALSDYERPNLNLNITSVGDFGSHGWIERMSDVIASNHYVKMCIENRWNDTFLPLQLFDFIEEKGRQPAYLFNIFYGQSFSSFSVSQWERFDRLTNLGPKQKFIALFDWLNTGSLFKQNKLNELLQSWVRRQHFVRKLSWYGTGKQKEKCEIAWEWYQDNHQASVSMVPMFSTIEDVLSFLDTAGFRDDEQLYHLEQIRKKFKNLQVQTNREAKIQTNMSLSYEVRGQLDELARINNRTKTEMVESLIRVEYETQVKK